MAKHKLFTSTPNRLSERSEVLHRTDIHGSEERARQTIEQLEAEGHTYRGWIIAEDEEPQPQRQGKRR